jgi:hypothetical protein
LQIDRVNFIRKVEEISLHLPLRNGRARSVSQLSTPKAVIDGDVELSQASRMFINFG